MFSFDLGGGELLRLLDESDAVELFALIEADRAALAQWMPWAGGQRLEDTIVFIRRARQQLADNNGFQAAILVDGVLAGTIGYHGVDWDHRSTSIGYWLGSDHQGRGTMTRAARALVDWAFRGWELNRVVVQAAPENRRSRAVIERLGFTEEGVLRQAERIGERYLDNVVYSMLASEWGTTTALPSNRPARKSASASSARSSS